MQRSLLLFLESVRSKATQKQYLYYLNSFLEKSGFGTDYDSFILTDIATIQIKVEDCDLTEENRKSQQRAVLHLPIQSFLDANDIDLKWKKIKRLYPANIKKGGKSAYTTEQIKQLLDTVKGDLRSELVIHIMAIIQFTTVNLSFYLRECRFALGCIICSIFLLFFKYTSPQLLLVLTFTTFSVDSCFDI